MTNYKSRLEDLGFEIRKNEYGNEIINFNNDYGRATVGYFNKSRVGIGGRAISIIGKNHLTEVVIYPDNNLDKVITAAEILENAEIPYEFKTLNKNIETLEKEIAGNQDLMDRLKALKSQHKP